MKLYYHRTDGGAEYYGLNHVTCPNGEEEGVTPFIMRTDGNEIEIFTDHLQGVALVIDGKEVKGAEDVN